MATSSFSTIGWHCGSSIVGWQPFAVVHRSAPPLLTVPYLRLWEEVVCLFPPHRPVLPQCPALPQPPQCLIQQAEICSRLPASQEFSGKYIHVCTYVQCTCTYVHIK